MFKQLISSIGKLKNDILAMPIGVIVVLIQSYILVDPVTFFGPVLADKYRWITLLYLIIELMVFALPDLRLRLFNVSIREAMPKFLLFTLLTYLATGFIATAFISIDYFPLFNPFSFAFLLPFITSFNASVSEESFFRDFLPQYMPRWLADVLFAGYHWGVYAHNLVALTMMFLLGRLWNYIKKKYSPKTSVANMGSHTGWTMAAKVFQKIRDSVPGSVPA